MSHVQLLLDHSRSDLDIVSQAESIETLAPMVADLDHMTNGIAMLEAVDQLALEREPTPQLYRMLVGALRTIADDRVRWSCRRSTGSCWLPRASPRCSTSVCAAASRARVALVAFDLTTAECCAARAGRARRCARGPELMRDGLGGRMNDALLVPPSSATHEIGAGHRHVPWSITSSVGCELWPCSNATDPPSILTVVPAQRARGFRRTAGRRGRRPAGGTGRGARGPSPPGRGWRPRRSGGRCQPTRAHGTVAGAWSERPLLQVAAVPPGVARFDGEADGGPGEVEVGRVSPDGRVSGSCPYSVSAAPTCSIMAMNQRRPLWAGRARNEAFSSHCSIRMTPALPDLRIARPGRRRRRRGASRRSWCH